MGKTQTTTEEPFQLAAPGPAEPTDRTRHQKSAAWRITPYATPKNPIRKQTTDYYRCRERIKLLGLAETDTQAALRLIQTLIEKESILKIELKGITVVRPGRVQLWGRDFTKEETCSVGRDTAETLWTIPFVRRLARKKEETGQVDSSGKNPNQTLLLFP